MNRNPFLVLMRELNIIQFCIIKLVRTLRSRSYLLSIMVNFLVLLSYRSIDYHIGIVARKSKPSWFLSWRQLTLERFSNLKKKIDFKKLKSDHLGGKGKEPQSLLMCRFLMRLVEVAFKRSPCWSLPLLYMKYYFKKLIIIYRNNKH